MASDSAATYGSDGRMTIGQQEISKIRRLSDSILYSSTGAVGMGQLVANSIKQGWDAKQFRAETPEEFMDKIGKKIGELVFPYLQGATLTRQLTGDASSSLCKSLLAIPFKEKSYLFQFDYNGAPERATDELPFVALGSGQNIADPFLALLKRLLWKDSKPTLGEGRVAAAWTIDHVRLTNPGGVGGRIQLATLAPKPGNQGPTATLLSEQEIGEHMQQVRSAEKALIDELRAPGKDEGEPPPTPPQL